jgi:hypothetical protein
MLWLIEASYHQQLISSASINSFIIHPQAIASVPQTRQVTPQYFCRIPYKVPSFEAPSTLLVRLSPSD